MKKTFSRYKNKDVNPRRRSSVVEDGVAQQSATTYRRNRTLTGSSSVNISSSNEYNADFTSPRAHIHHLSKKRRKLTGYFVLVTIVGVVMYALVSQAIASVAVVVVAPANLTPQRQQQYETRINSYFDHFPLDRTLFSINKERLLRYVAADYHEVTTLSIEPQGGPGGVRVHVGLRVPIAKWSLRGQNEFVDQQGAVFSYNAYTEPTLQIIDSSGVETSEGLVASNRFLAFVGRVIGASKEQGFSVVEASIPPLTTRQLEVRVDSVSYPIKLTIDRSAGEQAEDMARAIKHLKEKGTQPAYLDVRIEGRAVYK